MRLAEISVGIAKLKEQLFLEEQKFETRREQIVLAIEKLRSECSHPKCFNWPNPAGEMHTESECEVCGLVE